MQISTGLLFVLLVILFATTVLFLVLFVTAKSNRVSPENCPKITGNYSVTPNVTDSASIKLVNLCGPVPDGTPGTQPCNFNGVTSVYDAIQICNKYTNGTCNGFLYSPTNNAMTMINTSYSISSDTVVNSVNGDVYIRQNNTN